MADNKPNQLKNSSRLDLMIDSLNLNGMVWMSARESNQP